MTRRTPVSRSSSSRSPATPPAVEEVRTTPPTGEKLHKVLARLGVASRREAEDMIVAGRVSVNGRVATLGERVQGSDHILLDGHPVQQPGAERVRLLIYNKPEGEVCTRKDPEGRPTVFDRLPRLKHGRWIVVGRLDCNTTGLLLFTTDGELANRLMHPSTGLDREYVVRVRGEVDHGVLQRLREGVLLEDGMARFSDIKEGRSSDSHRWFHVVLMEGRNREVRRLWESQGVMVSRLKRVRYGYIFLPSRLKMGEWEYITGKDAALVYEMAGLPLPEIYVPRAVLREQGAAAVPAPSKVRPGPGKPERSPKGRAPEGEKRGRGARVKGESGGRGRADQEVWSTRPPEASRTQRVRRPRREA